MIRVLKVAGLVLATLLLLTAILLAWMLWTQSGSRFAIARAEGFLPPGTEVGTVHGRLADRVEMQNVRLHMDGLDLSIDRLWLEWSPAELLGGHLQIAELGASGVNYRALPDEQAEEPTEPFSLPQRVELPVSVMVERASLQEVRARTAPESEPLHIDRLSVSRAAFADARLEVDALEVRSPLLRADGRLTLTTAADYPTDVRLEWHFPAEGFAPVDGVTTLGGSLAALEIDQRLASPYRVRAQGTVTGLVAADEPMAISLRLSADEVVLAQVAQQLPEATLTADAAVEGPVDALEVRANVSGTDAQARRFDADLQALVTDDAVTIRELAVRQGEREGRLTGQGRIALAREVSADLSIQWESLRWPLTGAPTVVSPRGTLELDGPLDDYRLNLTTRLEPTQSPPLDLELSGDGSLEALDVSLSAEGGGGDVEGRLSAAWGDVIQAEVTLRAVGLDPSLVAQDWPGSVNLDLKAAGRMENDTLRVTVANVAAGGDLRNQPLSVTGRGHYAREADAFRVVIDDLEASLGDSRISVQGSVAERADLRWQLASDDLSSLMPQARGRIDGSGLLTGPLPRVSLEADLQARDLAYGDAGSLARLDLEADVDLSGETTSRFTLTAGQASVGETHIQQLALEGSGRPGGHRLRASLEAEAGRAELALEGRVADPWGDSPAWHYTVAEGELAYADLAPWQLARSASGLVTAGQVQVERQCWQSSGASLCLQGRAGDQGLNADLEISSLRFAYFDAFLPEGMEMTGAVDASAHLSRAGDGALTAQASVDTTAGSLTLPTQGAEDGEAVTVGLEPSRLTLDVDESEASGRLALHLEHGQLRARAATSATLIAGPQGADTERPASDQPLTGDVHLDVPELAFLSELLPTLEEVQGSIQGDLQLAGTLGAPTLAGSLDLERGAVTVPEPGITLADLTASLEGRGRELALQASASSGGGDLSLDGLLNLPGQPPLAQLTITGTEFEVIDNDEAQVLISPDLDVEAGSERIRITGRVHVPEAAITPGARSPQAVTVSEDQVLLSDDQEQEMETPRELYAEVRLTLGDQVRFEGYGLTAQIDGDVLVNQEPESPATATGELQIVEGEYRAYGQGLVIDSGRIYFAGGPVTQPALDVRAVRRPAEDILVGARVQGTLQSPSFELFSEPSMTQQEQLSWLVLGRSLEEAPDGQESALNRAALAMGIRGGDFLARNIGDELGLDQVGIETGSGEAGAPSDPSQAALVVGKYLSPKLYVSYGIGLFSPESVLEMQYEISSNWKLITQSSGESTGADVLYTVEAGGK